MKKFEFLRELEISLKGRLSETDIHEILSDYNDVFEDGFLENRDEDDISEGIGSPAAIAKAIVDDSTSNAPRDTNTPVTPDTYNLAPMSKRLLAYLLDTIIISLIFVGLLMTIYTPGIGFSQTTITESSISNPGPTDYTQKLYLDNNKSLKKVKLYKDNKKIFSGKMHDFDKFMQSNLDIKINSVQTIQKSTPFLSKPKSNNTGGIVYSYSYPLDEPGTISAIMPFILFFPYLLIVMALGFANIFTAFELWLFKGYTLGKWITKIRVVRTDNSNVTFWDTFVRDILLKFGASLLTSGILNMVSFIMGSATADHKTIHDLAAKTKVINIER